MTVNVTMPLGYTLSPLKLTGGTQKGAVFLDLAQLLKSREVDDVRGATIMHEDSPGIKSFYREHYDQGVIMRLLHPPGVFFQEKCVHVRSSLLHGGDFVDVVQLSLI